MLDKMYVDLDIVTKSLQRFKNGSCLGSTKEEMFLDGILPLLARSLLSHLSKNSAAAAQVCL